MKKGRREKIPAHTYSVRMQERTSACVFVCVCKRAATVGTAVFISPENFLQGKSVSIFRHSGLFGCPAPVSKCYTSKIHHKHIYKCLHTHNNTHIHTIFIGRKRKTCNFTRCVFTVLFLFRSFFFSLWRKKKKWLRNFRWLFSWLIEIERLRFWNSFLLQIKKNPKNEENENPTRPTWNPMKNHCSRFCVGLPLILRVCKCIIWRQLDWIYEATLRVYGSLNVLTLWHKQEAAIYSFLSLSIHFEFEIFTHCLWVSILLFLVVAVVDDYLLQLYNQNSNQSNA